MTTILIIMDGLIKSWLHFLMEQSISLLLLFPVIFLFNLVFKKNQMVVYGLWIIIFASAVIPYRHIQNLFFSISPSFPRTPILMEYPEWISSNVAYQSASLKTATIFQMDWIHIVFIIWIVCFIMLLIRHFYKLSYFLRIIQNSTQFQNTKIQDLVRYKKREYRLKRSIRILETSKETSPFTFGLFRPVIVIPAKLHQKHLEPVISHELMHVKCWDHFWIHLQNIIKTMYFFHPVVWIANCEIHRLRECFCDTLVLSRDNSLSQAYGETLLEALKLKMKDKAHSVLAFGSPYQFIKHRIKNVKGEKRMNKISIIKDLLVLLCLFVIMLPVTTIAVKAGNASTDSTGIQFQAPLKGKISLEFGYKGINPVTKKEFTHIGVDIPKMKGTQIAAVSNGIVLVSEENTAYGKHIIIQHGQEYQSLYAHLDTLMVKAGESVQSGKCIGLVGNTGYSTGPHLHFELIHKNERIDPESLIDFSEE